MPIVFVCSIGIHASAATLARRSFSFSYSNLIANRRPTAASTQGYSAIQLARLRGSSRSGRRRREHSSWSSSRKE